MKNINLLLTFLIIILINSNLLADEQDEIVYNEMVKDCVKNINDNNLPKDSVGWCYYGAGEAFADGREDLGVKINKKKAFYWYKKGANLGHTGAQLSAANLIYFKNVKANIKNAIYWYEKVVEGENPIHQDTAFHLLANIYFYGRDGVKDIDKGIKYYTKLADKDGWPLYTHDARHRLGYFYKDDEEGVPKDLNKSLKYFKLNAENKDIIAMFIIASIYSELEDYRQFVKWAEKLISFDFNNKSGFAKIDEKEALENKAFIKTDLANMYFVGVPGVIQNYGKAAQYAIEAAEENVSGAQYMLGYLYANGIVFKQNLIFAHMWLNIAKSGGASINVKDIFDQVESNLLSGQILEAQNLALNCVKNNYKSCSDYRPLE
jgi:uncharacterized protein